MEQKVYWFRPKDSLTQPYKVSTDPDFVMNSFIRKGDIGYWHGFNNDTPWGKVQTQGRIDDVPASAVPPEIRAAMLLELGGLQQ